MLPTDMRINRSLCIIIYYFYLEVNLDKGCPFWPDDSRCAIKDCAVDVCSEDEVPIGISKFKVSIVYHMCTLDLHSIALIATS